MQLVTCSASSSTRSPQEQSWRPDLWRATFRNFQEVFSVQVEILQNRTELTLGTFSRSRRVAATMSATQSKPPVPTSCPSPSTGPSPSRAICLVHTRTVFPWRARSHTHTPLVDHCEKWCHASRADEQLRPPPLSQPPYYSECLPVLPGHQPRREDRDAR